MMLKVPPDLRFYDGSKVLLFMSLFMHPGGDGPLNGQQK